MAALRTTQIGNSIWSAWLFVQVYGRCKRAEG